MPFFAILALLTTALTVVNSGTDVEQDNNRSSYDDYNRHCSSRPILSAFHASRYFLSVWRNGEYNAVLGRKKKKKKKIQQGEKWEGKNVSKREKFEGKKLGRWDGWCAAIGNNGRRVFRAFATSLDIPTNECLDQLRDRRGEPTRLWNRRWHSIRSHVRLGKKFYYDGSITVGLSERFSRDDERN